MKAVYFLLVMLFTTVQVCGQIKGIKLFIRSDFFSDQFDVYMTVTEGTATTIQQRGQGNAQITIVTSNEVNDISIINNMPLRANQNYTGTVPMLWLDDLLAESPTIDPMHNYFTIVPSLSPSAFYNNLQIGDEVKLFTIKTPAVICHDKIRIYRNGEDPNGMHGGDFKNGFAIGSPLELFKGLINDKEKLFVGETMCEGSTLKMTHHKSNEWIISDLNKLKIEDHTLIAIKEGVIQIQASADQGKCMSPIYDIAIVEGPHLEAIDGKLVVSESSGIFKWYDCNTDLVIAETIEPSFSPTISGRYYVEAITENCHAKTACVDFILSSAKFDDHAEFLIFPSVSNGKLSIKSQPSQYKVELYDMDGILICQFYHSQKNTVESLDLTHLKEGMYLIKLIGHIGFSQKVIITK